MCINLHLCCMQLLSITVTTMYITACRLCARRQDFLKQNQLNGLVKYLCVQENDIKYRIWCRCHVMYIMHCCDVLSASFPGRLPLRSWLHTWPLNRPEKQAHSHCHNYYNRVHIRHVRVHLTVWWRRRYTRPSPASPGGSKVTYSVKRTKQEMAWERG